MEENIYIWKEARVFVHLIVCNQKQYCKVASVSIFFCHKIVQKTVIIVD